MSENKKNLSIADLLALLALAALSVTEGVGLYLGGDGDATIPIFAGLAFGIGFGLLWVLLKKAKKTNENPHAWLAVEIACFVIYIAAAWFFKADSIRFMSVMSNKKELSNQAKTDLNSIAAMYTQYETERYEALTNAKTMLDNFYKVAQNDRIQHNLYQEYVKPFDFDPTVTSAWDGCTQIQNNNLSNYQTKVNSLLAFPKLAKFLTEATDPDFGVYKDLKDKIAIYKRENHIIPIITDEDNKYRLKGWFDFQYTLPLSNFADNVKSPANKSGSWLYFLGHLLILLSYIAAERSRFVGLHKKGNIGGKPLA